MDARQRLKLKQRHSDLRESIGYTARLYPPARLLRLPGLY
jgi:hypothetical protein